jgi:hypothetical protein
VCQARDDQQAISILFYGTFDNKGCDAKQMQPLEEGKLCPLQGLGYLLNAAISY